MGFANVLLNFSRVCFSRDKSFRSGCFFLSYLFRQKGTQKTFLLNGLCHRTAFLQQHNPCRCMLLTPDVAQASSSVKS